MSKYEKIFFIYFFFQVDQKVNNLLEQSSTPAPQANNETHSRKQRLTQAGKIS